MTVPPGFQFALRSDELAEGDKVLLEIEERLVIVFRIGNQFFCLDDVCTHDGGSLADGEHCGFEIACPRHGARFDIRTGEPLCMPATEATAVHQCLVSDGQVFVRLSS